ncbi:MAG: toll/interleukin-1 receptor domain-containing protein [Ktedonobacterales bacterium]
MSTAASSSIPRHVFISYAHADAAFVNRLVDDLERANIPCWVDRWGLQPGTPDWEQAIREAIADAFAVVLIASPASRQALAVQGEMALAGNSACRVIPLWVAGDRWEDSVALTLIRTQYIDCRDGRYGDAVTGIVAALQGEWDRLVPQQAVLTHTWPPLAGYVSIALADGRTVAFRAGAYPTVQTLLNALYLGYLREVYRPFTYGRDWLLANTLRERQEMHVLAVPWSWLQHTARATPLSQSERDWDAVPLDTYGLAGGTVWAVQAPPPVAMGVATNNAEFDKVLADFCRGEVRKEMDLLVVEFLPQVAGDRSGRFTRADLTAQVLPSDGVVPAGYPYRYVLGGTGRNESALRRYDGHVLSYQSADSQAPVDWWGY